MILGISVDNGHARGILMDEAGAIRARGASTVGDIGDRLAVVARDILASANGSGVSAVGVSFPDPDSKAWPIDLACLADAVGKGVAVRTLSSGNASALAEVWYGAGKRARDLIAF